ncbi:NIPSNAP family protein [Streptosporangium sp. NPDC049644]|uniref:NIPSNAP family protein n=1 Tax=Streptosporangium sp. NPDC049644 TaxID=3155507 RepID=UPI00343B9901
MQDNRYPIVELRQYTLHEGGRDVLIDLFEREFIESQEAAGMTVIGQFRDLDAPNRFVWLRGFPGMERRAGALRSFYGGPVWKANRDRANATMIDSDDVLLLRAGADFPASARPPVGGAAPPSIVTATIYHRDRPFDDAFVDFFDRSVRPVMAETGARPLACLRTEYAENTFPALPVRTGENVFVWFSRFTGPDHLADHQDRLARSRTWHDRVLPELSETLTGAPRRLRLAPTARSLLR